MKKGIKADKGTENKIWTEGKQKGDESPKLTQRQNGLLINSGDNGRGIFWPNGSIHNQHPMIHFISGSGWFFIIILELFLRKWVLLKLV